MRRAASWPTWPAPTISVRSGGSRSVVSERAAISVPRETQTRLVVTSQTISSSATTGSLPNSRPVAAPASAPTAVTCRMLCASSPNTRRRDGV
jgi:hypothetical protein